MSHQDISYSLDTYVPANLSRTMSPWMTPKTQCVYPKKTLWIKREKISTVTKFPEEQYPLFLFSFSPYPGHLSPFTHTYFLGWCSNVCVCVPRCVCVSRRVREKKTRGEIDSLQWALGLSSCNTNRSTPQQTVSVVHTVTLTNLYATTQVHRLQASSSSLRPAKPLCYCTD